MGVKDPLMLISTVELYSCPPGYLDVLGCRITVTNSLSKLCDEHAQCVTGATLTINRYQPIVYDDNKATGTSFWNRQNRKR